MSSKQKKEEYDKLLELDNQLDKILKEPNNKFVQVNLLHQYNDIKDATQVVINYLANIEGTTITEIHKRLNLTD